MIEAFELAQSRVQAKIESTGIGYVPLPDQSFAVSGLTKTEYSRNSQALVDPNVRHAADDVSHMNAAYGMLQMQKLLSELGL
jgi:hypothetical protein